MRDEYQTEANRVRARKRYYQVRDIKEHKAYLDAVEEVRIRNRDIALMNEVRKRAQEIIWINPN